MSGMARRGAVQVALVLCLAVVAKGFGIIDGKTCFGMMTDGTGLVLDDQLVGLSTTAPSTQSSLRFKAKVSEADDASAFEIFATSTIRPSNRFRFSTFGFSEATPMHGLWINAFAEDSFFAGLFFVPCDVEPATPFEVTIDIMQYNTTATLESGTTTCTVVTDSAFMFDRRRLQGSDFAVGLNFVAPDGEDLAISFGGDNATEWSSLKVCY